MKPHGNIMKNKIPLVLFLSIILLFSLLFIPISTSDENVSLSLNKTILTQCDHTSGTHQGTYNRNARWSPDGVFYAFGTADKSGPTVRWASNDTIAKSFNIGDHASSIDWSDDGNYFGTVERCWNNGGPDIWVWNVSSDNPNDWTNVYHCDISGTGICGHDFKFVRDEYMVMTFDDPNEGVWVFNISDSDPNNWDTFSSGATNIQQTNNDEHIAIEICNDRDLMYSNYDSDNTEGVSNYNYSWVLNISSSDFTDWVNNEVFDGIENGSTPYYESRGKLRNGEWSPDGNYFVEASYDRIDAGDTERGWLIWNFTDLENVDATYVDFGTEFQGTCFHPYTNNDLTEGYIATVNKTDDMIVIYSLTGGYSNAQNWEIEATWDLTTQDDYDDILGEEEMVHIRFNPNGTRLYVGHGISDDNDDDVVDDDDDDYIYVLDFENPLSPVDDEEISFQSINNQENNTITQEELYLFNASFIDITPDYFVLNISNNSDMSSPFLSITFDESDDNCWVNGSYVEYILPSAYRKSWYQYYYCQISVYYE